MATCGILTDSRSGPLGGCASHLRGRWRERRVAEITDELLIIALLPTTVPFSDQLCLS